MSRIPIVRRIRRFRRREEGYVLVMTALMLLGLMIMAAFTIDVGLWYSRANRLQRAADAAALAGVTYMPNLTQAYAVAMDAAAKNGFDSSNLQLNVVPASVPGAPRRLSVTLTDTNVPAIFGSMLMNHISITRSATAEYVSQVPVGSPLNAIGTGDQPGFQPGGGVQGFYLAVGGYCTAKEDGDRFLSYYDGNRQQTPSPTYVCSPASHPNPAQVVQNIDYRPEGYDYIVHIPCGNPDPTIPCAPGTTATSDTKIQLYDPAFEPANPTGLSDPADTRPDLKIAPQANPDWAAIQVTTTFEVWDTNYTPTDPSDDVLVQSTQYPSCIGVLPSCPAAWVDLYTIPTGAHAGNWKIRVYTKANEAKSYGVNAFSIRAAKGGVWALCDGRVDGTCPGVAGDSNLAVLLNIPTTATFYLARFAPAAEFRGKQVQLLLWDPGERANTIQILDNNGNPAPFQYQTWSPGIVGYPDDTAIPLSAATTSLDVSGGLLAPTPGWAASSRFNQQKFNDRMLSILLDIPTDYGMSGPLNNDGWWQIRYTASVNLKDLSTWSVTLLGDPVHLVRG